MDAVTIVLVIVAIIVVGGIIAYVMSRSGRAAEARRAKAAEIREEAAEHDRRLREDEVSAAEARARSEMARVEAQKRELEAERLAAEADSRSQSAAAARQERDERLRLADERDPDVRTGKDGQRLDDDVADVREEAVDERDRLGSERREGPYVEGYDEGRADRRDESDTSGWGDRRV